MPGKVKMRCAHCGKTFKSNGKQTLCDDCEAKERAARAAGKNTPARPAVASPTLQRPQIVGAGARILDPTLPEPLDPAPTLAPAPRERPPFSQDRAAQPVASAPPQASRPPSAPAAAPARQPERTARGKSPRQERPPRPSKPPRLPRESQGPVELSADQREMVEARYLELATPVEFDGIRTQIATELTLPKSAVKKAIAELRARMQMPSWWELQAYKGTEADLERIRQAYLPLLPLPEVGVHKRIAAELGIDQTLVYQAIRRIRAELRLPQYNPRAAVPVRAAAPTSPAGEPSATGAE
jgi:hypothetical protein